VTESQCTTFQESGLSFDFHMANPTSFCERISFKARIRSLDKQGTRAGATKSAL